METRSSVAILLWEALCLPLHSTSVTDRSQNNKVGLKFTVPFTYFKFSWFFIFVFPPSLNSFHGLTPLIRKGQTTKVNRIKGMVRKGREEGEANLWGGCHTDLWDKIVIKQVDDVLLLQLLGRSEFWRWWNWRAFPQLHASEHMATAQTATPKKPETGTRLAKTKKN